MLIEPMLVKVWILGRTALLFGYPYREIRLSRIEQYYDRIERSPFGFMSPLRIKLRKWIQTIGICLLTLLATNAVFNFINL